MRKTADEVATVVAQVFGMAHNYDQVVIVAQISSEPAERLVSVWGRDAWCVEAATQLAKFLIDDTPTQLWRNAQDISARQRELEAAVRELRTAETATNQRLHFLTKQCTEAERERDDLERRNEALRQGLEIANSRFNAAEARLQRAEQASRQAREVLEEDVALRGSGATALSHYTDGVRIVLDLIDAALRPAEAPTS